MTQAQYDPTESRELTTVIISAIAEAEGVPITEILSPPHYEVVDTAALERALFCRRSVSGNDTGPAVEFRHNEYKASVEADGWVTVARQSEGPPTDQP